MLLRNLRPDVHKIQRHGERADGIVVDVHAWPAGTIGISRFTLTVHARFADGTGARFRRYATSKEFDGYSVSPGDKLPIRYDPSDHAKVEIDYAAFRDHERAVGRARDAERVRGALADD